MGEPPGGHQSGVVGTPQGPRPCAQQVRERCAIANVHHIVEILSAHDIPFYIAGGWGVDALAGRQTRSHDDLDVVVDDYETHIQKALAAFEADGFSILSDYTRRAWMPRSLTMMNMAHVRMDLVSLNWRILAEAFGPDGASAEDRASFVDKVFTTGTIGGRRVPCLAADVQLLYHSLFELRAPMKGDVSVLRDELGASNPWD